MFLNNLHLVLFLRYNKIQTVLYIIFIVLLLLNFGHAVILLSILSKIQVLLTKEIQA